jgi:hypothetical protein
LGIEKSYFAEILPIETAARERSVRQPGDRDVVENVIAGQLGLSLKDARDQLVAAYVVIYQWRDGQPDFALPIQQAMAGGYLFPYKFASPNFHGTELGLTPVAGAAYSANRSGMPFHQGTGTGLSMRPEARTIGRCARRWTEIKSLPPIEPSCRTAGSVWRGRPLRSVSYEFTVLSRERQSHM